MSWNIWDIWNRKWNAWKEGGDVKHKPTWTPDPNEKIRATGGELSASDQSNHTEGIEEENMTDNKRPIAVVGKNDDHYMHAVIEAMSRVKRDGRCFVLSVNVVHERNCPWLVKAGNLCRCRPHVQIVRVDGEHKAVDEPMVKLVSKHGAFVQLSVTSETN